MRIVIDDDTIRHTKHDVFHKDVILGELVIPVSRYAHFSATDQIEYLLKCLAHAQMLAACRVAI